MIYTIKEIEEEEWRELWEKCPKSNLLQSWPYGIAKKNSHNLTPVNFLILGEGKPIALVQVLLKKLPIFFSVARINRGPVLIGDHELLDRKDIVLNIINLLISECRKMKCFLLQIAPELEQDDNTAKALSNLGLYKLSNPAWSSGLLNLQMKDEDLLMHLKGKWRNCLRKGHKMGVQVKHTKDNSLDINKVIETYQSLQKDKNFIGLSESLLRELSNKVQKNWQFNIFRAFIDDSEDHIGILVTIEHGDTAIYLIGATNDLGRQHQANYVLLWYAIQFSKNNNCSWFDIGGLNKTTPRGVAHFKNGLKATPYNLIGEWRKIFFPRIF